MVIFTASTHPTVDECVRYAREADVLVGIMVPGEPWFKNMERGLFASKSCAVFVGKSGEVPWQQKEVAAALDRQAKSPDFGVVPVHLPGNTWVESRTLADEDALWRLECGIRRIEPQRGKCILNQGCVQPESAQRAHVAPGGPAESVLVAQPSGYELVRIPAGVFRMGSPKEEKGRFDAEGPLHQVQVADFYLGRTPVTNELYAAFLKESPGMSKPALWADRQFNQPRQPLVGVSCDEAQRHAGWIGLRLPNEAEWEYACRAGSRTRFFTGDTDDDLARVGWYADNAGGKLHPVGEKEPNGFGLYDMHGNVFEWVEDGWHGSYDGAPDDGSNRIDSPRVFMRMMCCGGSFCFDASVCRSALRFANPPGYRLNVLGFRLSRSIALGP